MPVAQREAGKGLLLTGIHKSYGKVAAVKDLDLHVGGGELVALLGPSGCGKTTTLRIVAGFEQPDTGTVEIDGEEISSLPPHKRHLGMVFQNYSLFPHRTVAENIGFGLRMAGMAKSARDERINTMLDLVHLQGRGDVFPAKLSGGQQQRVALARSLVVNPKVLLLDEPLGALDKSLRESMQFEIRGMQQRLGITALLVTHDQEEAMSMADKVAVMNGGRILQIGAPADIYDRPKSRFVAEFLGTSNIFEGRASDDGSALVVSGPHGPFSLTLPQPQAHGQPFLLSVRPERMTLTPGETSDGRGSGFAGRVVGAVFRGNYAAYQVDVPALGRELFVYRQADGPLGSTTYHLGQAVLLNWAPQDGVIVSGE